MNNFMIGKTNLSTIKYDIVDNCVVPQVISKRKKSKKMMNLNLILLLKFYAFLEIIKF